MFAQKLQAGDEIRIIAPARSLDIVAEQNRTIAEKRLKEMGLKVTYGKHVYECDDFNSSSILSRIQDLHEAFRDKEVKGILTVIGGFNSNQLLRFIDYKLIQDNPKILCGYSDITALLNAIYTRSGLVTYYGPHFSTFGMVKGCDYIIDYFKQCLMSEGDFKINSSKEWSSDPWYEDQENRVFLKNEGYWIVNEGEAEGKVVGGNQCSFNLLHGTEFMPSLKDTVLFLEDDDEAPVAAIDRDLQSIIHQPGFEEVRGIVFGRFQPKTGMTQELFTKMIKTKQALNAIPVIANADFGHTTPMITFPIGGKIKLDVAGGTGNIFIMEH